MTDDQVHPCKAATVWTVCNAEYDDQTTIGIFATQDLAEAFAKGRPTSHVEVFEEIVHDHVPQDVTYYCLSVYVLHDGTVLRNGACTQEHWDCQLPKPVTVTRLTDRDRVEVWERDQAAAEYAMFETLRELITSNGARDDRASDWGREALAAAEIAVFGVTSAPPSASYCYEASFGRVHYTAGCRCK